MHLSDTRPEQKEPRAKPVKSSILARVLSQLFSHTRSHSAPIRGEHRGHVTSSPPITAHL